MSDCVDCSIPHRVEELERKCERYGLAFPALTNGEADIGGHRDYHERKILAARAEEEFWTSLKLDLAKKGIWTGLIILFGFIGLGVLYALRKKLELMP